jgi:hypothetical protein
MTPIKTHSSIRFSWPPVAFRHGELQVVQTGAHLVEIAVNHEFRGDRADRSLSEESWLISAPRHSGTGMTPEGVEVRGKQAKVHDRWMAQRIPGQPAGRLSPA